jgi:tRNA 2-thiouridine synthesizing protein A
MTMTTKIDARGLSCPQPVILTHKKIEDMAKGVIEVLVDTETSRENVSRLAQRAGWTVETKKEGDNYSLILSKS